MVVWIVIIGLIFFNALYVAAEFAAVGVRHSHIRKLAQEGNSLARGMLPILEDPRRLDRYIAACQIGITVSSLMLGAIGQRTLAVGLSPIFADLGGMQEVAAESTAAIIALMFLTAVQVVFGELVPKSLALQFPARLALLTYLPMRWSLVIFSWFIAVLNGSGLFLLRLIGVSDTGHRHLHSPEEIDMMIAESREGGLLEPDVQERLHHALDLTRRSTRELMVPRRRIVAIDVDMTPDELFSIATESPYSRLPVYDDNIDNVIGLVHVKDLVVRFIDTGNMSSPRDVLRPITSVPDSLTAEGLLTLMRERQAHLAVVLDEYGGVQGIVTIEDIIRELFGELTDEFNAETVELQRLDDGSIRVPGEFRLDSFVESTGIDWNGSSTTVAGHIMSVLGHLPTPGEEVVIEGVNVRIERMDGPTIASALIIPPESALEQDREEE